MSQEKQREWSARGIELAGLLLAIGCGLWMLAGNPTLADWILTFILSVAFGGLSARCASMWRMRQARNPGVPERFARKA